MNWYGFPCSVHLNLPLLLPPPPPPPPPPLYHVSVLHLVPHANATLWASCVLRSILNFIFLHKKYN